MYGGHVPEQSTKNQSPWPGTSETPADSLHRSHVGGCFTLKIGWRLPRQAQSEYDQLNCRQSSPSPICRSCRDLSSSKLGVSADRKEKINPPVPHGAIFYIWIQWRSADRDRCDLLDKDNGSHSGAKSRVTRPPAAIRGFRFGFV